MKRYGNTFSIISHGVIATSVVGIIAGLLCLFFGKNQGDTIHRILNSVFLCLLMPGVFFIACSPTLLFSIEIDNGRIKHMLLNKLVISDLPVQDFTNIIFPQPPWAAVLYFNNNKKIRFFGAHLRVLLELKEDLKHFQDLNHNHLRINAHKKSAP